MSGSLQARFAVHIFPWAPVPLSACTEIHVMHTMIYGKVSSRHVNCRLSFAVHGVKGMSMSCEQQALAGRHPDV